MKKKIFTSILGLALSLQSISIAVVNAEDEKVQPTLNDINISIKGDINADGEFNVADVVTFQKWLLDNDVELKNWKAADLCKDDKLDVFDLCLMKRELLDSDDEHKTLASPPMYDTFYCKSYDELYEFLLSENNENIERYGEQYPLFKKTMEKGETPLMIPTFNGTPAEIKGAADWQNITVFTNELYNLPWIWYYCNYNGRCIVVGISYLDYLSEMDIAVPNDISSFMDGIGYNSPNPENKDKYLDTYNNIYYNTLKIASSEITASIYDAKSGRTYYRFITDGCLVSIWNYDGEGIEDKFWNEFSLKKYEG